MAVIMYLNAWQIEKYEALNLKVWVNFFNYHSLVIGPELWNKMVSSTYDLSVMTDNYYSSPGEKINVIWPEDFWMKEESQLDSKGKVLSRDLATRYLGQRGINCANIVKSAKGYGGKASPSAKTWFSAEQIQNKDPAIQCWYVYGESETFDVLMDYVMARFHTLSFMFTTKDIAKAGSMLAQIFKVIVGAIVVAAAVVSVVFMGGKAVGNLITATTQLISAAIALGIAQALKGAAVEARITMIAEKFFQVEKELFGRDHAFRGRSGRGTGSFGTWVHPDYYMSTEAQGHGVVVYCIMGWSKILWGNSRLSHPDILLGLPRCSKRTIDLGNVTGRFPCSIVLYWNHELYSYPLSAIGSTGYHPLFSLSER